MEDAQERVKRLGPELQSDTSKKQKSYEVKEVPFIESQKGTQQLLSRRRLSSQSRSQGDRNQWLGRGNNEILVKCLQSIAWNHKILWDRNHNMEEDEYYRDDLSALFQLVIDKIT
ncbi:hypothetical protein Tco_0768609 [Tanacetum coccineum]